MTKYLIEIDCDNAAFEDNLEGELPIILRRASAKLSNGEFDFKLRDSNGNTVGSAYLEEDEPDELVEDTSDDEEKRKTMASEDREFTRKGIEDYPFKEDHVYIVDVAWRSSNPVHRAILHVGFLNKGHSFGGYCEVWSHSYEEAKSASNAYYLKVIKDLGPLRDEKVECVV